MTTLDVFMARLFTLVASKSMHTNDYAAGVDGEVSDLELKIICSYARQHDGGIFFEIGTFRGRTARAMALAAPNSKVFTLDLPPDSTLTKYPTLDADVQHMRRRDIGPTASPADLGPNVTRVYGDSATFNWLENQYDLIFIDGAHSAAYVENDITKAMQALCPGGVMLVHDYGNPSWRDVTNVVDRHVQEHPGKWIMHLGTTLAAYAAQP